MKKSKTFSSTNWDAFGDIELQALNNNEKQLDSREEIDIAFHTTFSTESGQFVINYFKKFTLDLPSIPQGLSCDDAVTYGCRREGQNDIIREIIFRTEKGKK